MCSTNPNRTIVFKFGATEGEPFAVELVDVFRSSAFIPIAFIHTNLFAALNADSAVAEEVRRVGKDCVNRVVLYLVESLHAITIEDGEVGICSVI